MNRFFLRCALILLFPLSAFTQTSVAGRSLGNEIVVGIDSKTIHWNDELNKLDTLIDVNNKLLQKGPVSYINIGPFDDEALIDSILTSCIHLPFRKMIRFFSSTFQTSVFSDFGDVRIDNPELYNQLLADSVIHQTFFFGVEHDSLKYANVLFVANKHADESVEVRVKIYENERGIFTPILADMDKPFDAGPYWSKGTTTGISHLISKENFLRQTPVYYPVEVYQISKKQVLRLSKQKIEAADPGYAVGKD